MTHGYLHYSDERLVYLFFVCRQQVDMGRVMKSFPPDAYCPVCSRRRDGGLVFFPGAASWEFEPCNPRCSWMLSGRSKSLGVDDTLPRFLAAAAEKNFIYDWDSEAAIKRAIDSRSSDEPRVLSMDMDALFKKSGFFSETSL